MRRLLTGTLLLALSACTREEAPARPAPLPAAAAAAPKPAAPAPAAPEKPAPAPPAPPAAESAKPPAPKPKSVQEGPLAQVHLPAITFRTMDHRAVPVCINGAELAPTPCLWSITEGVEFDPKIPVTSWPPEGARYLVTTQDREKESWHADVYRAEAKGLTGKFPHLRDGEVVLYVNASLQGRTFLGALRVSVEGYRVIDYTPLVNPEGEEASRFLRTIWLERIGSE